MAPTPKPDNPLDRRIAIMNHYESGIFVGQKSAEEIRWEVGGTVASISVALTALGFKTAERRKTRRIPTGQGRKTRVVTTPRKYAPPDNLDWPVKARLERQIRAQGASVRVTKNAFMHSAKVTESEMQQALGLLVAESQSAGARGALKKAVSTVKADQEAKIGEERRQLELERERLADENKYGRDAYWAKSLGESPDTARIVLYARGEGIIRALALRNPRQNFPG